MGALTLVHRLRHRFQSRMSMKAVELFNLLDHGHPANPSEGKVDSSRYP